MALERLQKILAQAGVASRRAAERLIRDGHVRVNGRIVTELGSKANLNKDRVEVDGKRLVAEKPVYYLMHKPREVVTTLDDPEGRKNIADLVKDVRERLFPVGRLDFQTSGALLLTNDGDMAQALLHPKRAVPKIYSVKLQGRLDDRGLTALREGVVLDDGQKTQPATVSMNRFDERHTFLDITITEGKNRQIHRMAEAIGRRVLRLTRISFAGLSLESLRPGEMRPLLPSELNELKAKYLNPGKDAAARKGRRNYDDGMDFDEARPSFQIDEDEVDAREVPHGEHVPRNASVPARTMSKQPARNASAPARTMSKQPARVQKAALQRIPDRAMAERMPPSHDPRRRRKLAPKRMPGRGKATRVEVKRKKGVDPAVELHSDQKRAPVRAPQRGAPTRTPRRSTR